MKYDDYKRLREFAEAATPGPWKTTDGYREAQAGRYDDLVSVIEDAHGESIIEHVYYDGHHTIVKPNDVAYITAVSPDVVIGLLDDIKTLQNEVVCQMEDKEFEREERRKAGAKWDEFKAEYENLYRQWRNKNEACNQAYAIEIPELTAERDRLRAALNEACDIAMRWIPGPDIGLADVSDGKRIAEIRRAIGKAE